MAARCRLLYVVGQLGAGGLERQLSFLLEGMNRTHYQPEVVVWNLREDDTYLPQLLRLGVPLHSLAGLPSAVAKVKALRRLVGQIHPEVVHSYSFYTNFAAWWATLGRSVIGIGAVQSDFIRDKKRTGPGLGRLSARWPRSQIFNSFLAFENAGRSHGLFIPRHRFLVRNGLDLQRFQPVPPPSDNRVCVVGIGSLLPIKRWDRLIRATVELKRRGLDCLVQIAGDGPLRGSLEEQARMLGVADYVQFIGHTADVPGLLANATFLTHTSETEGTPNVVMEAMACGRAVVATDAGDTPLMIDDGTTGFVVRRGDDASLVERMASLITDRDRCRRMGTAARAKAEREFGVERLVSETLAVYRTVGWSDT